jgi:hypothetical protein
MPQESGSLLAVTKKLREFKLEQRQIMAEMRAERLALEQSRAPVVIENDQPPKADEPAGDNLQ